MRAPARPTHTTTTFMTADATAATGPVTPRATRTTSHTVDGSPAPSSRRPVKLSVGFVAAALAAIALTPTSARAQFRQVVEFSCPLTSDQRVPPADPFPGALVAEGNYVYYVTRSGELRLVRLTPGTSTCNWWDLDDLTVTTGGLRLKPWGSQTFIRGITDLQRINTMTNARTRWVDGLASISDVALRVVNGTNDVFTTGATTEACDPVGNPFGCLFTGTNVVQRFSVANGSNTGTATRWVVGGGAGTVQYSGIDFNPCVPNVVYYSEPLTNNIGELNTTTGIIRRWNLAALGVSEPRQLDVDSTGKVWVVTGSGHLVRLDPELTIDNVHVAILPASFLSNARALDADSLVGYTAEDTHKVGQFSPNLMNADTVSPAVFPAVTPTSLPLSVTPVTVTQFVAAAVRVAKTAPALVTGDLNMNGTFTEVSLNTATVNDPMSCPGADPNFPDNPCTFASTLPQGIANDPARAGAYYAAIGGSTLRVAHVTFTVNDFAGGGVVTGSGKMALTDPITGQPAGTGYFTLWAYKNGQSQPAKGALNYKAPDGKVDSLQITGLTLSGNTATITGLCKSGSSCTTFQLKATDGGWQASQDILKITKNPILGVGLEKGGNLGSGGIRMYRSQ
jgi:hypothetical protein